MRKFALILGLILCVCANARAQKVTNYNWNGIWEYQRYTNAASGVLEITACDNNECSFNISTVNGAHVCNIEGKLKTNDNKAEYKENVENIEGKIEDLIINFDLDTDKNIIKVDANRLAYTYCGMQGDFIGEYENKNNPLRYDAGFDCWAKNLTDTEKTICASQQLARVSKEATENYPTMQNKDWYNKRDICNNDDKCLWNFYISSIKSGYEEKSGKQVNLYEYMGDLAEDDLYYPTDFSLLTDFFIKNMQEKDYNEWTYNFSQISLDNNKCDNCYYHEYGLPGLYTIMESAFYISEDEIWLAFLHTDENSQEKYIILYTFSEKEEKDIPLVFNDWLNRLKPYFPNGIKLKYFSDKQISE